VIHVALTFPTRLYFGRGLEALPRIEFAPPISMMGRIWQTEHRDLFGPTATLIPYEGPLRWSGPACTIKGAALYSLTKDSFKLLNRRQVLLLTIEPAAPDPNLDLLLQEAFTQDPQLDKGELLECLNIALMSPQELSTATVDVRSSPASVGIGDGEVQAIAAFYLIAGLVATDLEWRLRELRDKITGRYSSEAASTLIGLQGEVSRYHEAFLHVRASNDKRRIQMVRFSLETGLFAERNQRARVMVSDLSQIVQLQISRRAERSSAILNLTIFCLTVVTVFTGLASIGFLGASADFWFEPDVAADRKATIVGALGAMFAASIVLTGLFAGLAAIVAFLTSRVRRNGVAS